MEEKVIDIEELAQDGHNFNKGNDEGQQLMERSFKELGAGRSILLDRNGNIIAGNKSQKAAIAAGIKRVRVVETTGDELVAVKRTDVDIDSAEGSPELELLAVEFSTLRRIAALLMADGHTDIVVTATKQELSTTNRTYNDLTKLFSQHMRDYRQQLIQAKIMRRT